MQFMKSLSFPLLAEKRVRQGCWQPQKKKIVPVHAVGNLVEKGVPAGAVHQSVAARVAPVWLMELEEFPTLFNVHESLIIVCDQIEDPMNLGAIARSVAAFGAQAMMIQARRGAPVSGVAVKASAGALAHIKVCPVINIAKGLDRLKDMGFWVAGLSPDGSTFLWDAPRERPLALVVGAEGAGLRPLVKKRCDFLVKIPILGNIDSINVSAALGIALYELAARGQT